MQQVFAGPDTEHKENGRQPSPNEGCDTFAEDLAQEQFEQALREAYARILPKNSSLVAIPELRKQVAVADFNARLLAMQDRGLATLLKAETDLAVSDEESLACPDAPNGGFYYRVVVGPADGSATRNQLDAWPAAWPHPSETTLDDGSVDVETNLGCDNGKGRINLLARVIIEYLDDQGIALKKTEQLKGTEVPVNSAEVKRLWEDKIRKNFPRVLNVTLLAVGNEADEFLCGLRPGQDGPEIRWSKGTR